MSDHVAAEVVSPDMSPEEFQRKIGRIDEAVLDDLEVQFELKLGLPPPKKDRAEILRFGRVLKYSAGVKKCEFLACISQLLKQRFRGDDKIVADKSLTVTESALSDIFDENETSLASFRGDSAKIESGGKVRVVAAFASTKLCFKADWRTPEDFYVAHYVFTVFPIADRRLQSFLRCRSI